MSSEPTSSDPKHTNRLADATSPYLLQHAHNPVDWWPWGEEALRKSRDENKPIFLSIGYAACHWCHVMAHESFENEAIAGLLNKHFVNIKVDREERPDLDDIYMKAVMALTGHGGWPMSVFLTPELKPFFGGTYFPPQDMHGRRGFGSLIHALADAWENQKDQIAEQSEQLTRYIQTSGEVPGGEAMPDETHLDKLYEQLRQQFDSRNGGFGGAPKFPHSMDLMFLLRYYQREDKDDALHMAHFSLAKMARGGMYDQVGGGFHRYSTDAEWLTPHFEKMLYDNALLARAYTEGWQLTGENFHKRIASEILNYIIREMTAPEGGFYSATDADSEGEEGKFFVWTPESIEAVLDEEEARVVKAFWDVSRTGNFEHGQSILNVPKEPDEVAETLGISVEHLGEVIDRARPKLYKAREERVHPLLDDKILTSWNGLMIGAMAFSGAAFGEERYVKAARNAATFILENLQKDGRLLRTWRKGHAHLNAYLDDYAFLASALVDLYEATFELKWLQEGIRLTDQMLELFWDEEKGGLFSTSHDHENLIARMKPTFDGAEPSGNSVAALTLLRIAELTGDNAYRERAESILKAFRETMEQAPMGTAQMHMALDFLTGSPKEIVLAGDPDSLEGEKALEVVWGNFLPRKVVAHACGGECEKVMPPVAGKTADNGQVAVYVCENFTCREPVSEIGELKKALGVE